MQDWFNQILRTVYRLIFLAVAEDRNLLHLPETKADIRDLYASNYGFSHWRERAARRLAYDHHTDNWETLNIVFHALEHGAKPLGLPALGSLFSSDQTPDLNNAKLSNRAFLEAMFRLAWFVENNVLVRINWRDMATEELGSVYEGLLELVPFRENGGRTFVFAGGAETKGNARKTSGSYYTPDSLVQTLLDSALDPVLDRAEQEGGAEELLKLKIIDPACGSGHFLLGGARRLANRVAQARNIDAPDYQAAMRDVVRSCIYGVDRNPMAVELAKVALWIESVTPGKPLGFLDANIVCGDSLLGIFDLKAIEDGIPDEAFKPLTGDDKNVANDLKKQNRAEREGQASFDWDRGEGGALPPEKLAADVGDLRDLPEDTITDIEAKKAKFAAWVVDPKRAATQLACDLHMAAFLMPKKQSDDLFTQPLIPTTANVRQALAGQRPGEAMVESARQAVRAASVLHWPLAFPEVMIGRGGFDVVIGNPPWERIKLQEQEFFASRDQDIATAANAAARTKLIKALAEAEPGTPAKLLHEAFQTAKRVAEASTIFFSSPKDEDPTKIELSKVTKARRYPWTGRGDVNTYALFAEHFLNLANETGRAGAIVPTGIATDATTAPFFGHLVGHERLASLIDFENREKLFAAVDSRMKFCLLTIGSGVIEADFAFFLTDPTQLEQSERRFTLSPTQIARINPNTKTAPVFRSRRDAELTANIYDRVPVLINESEGQAGNPWGVSFMAMFHMSNDSDLFRTAAQLAAQGLVQDGADWISRGGMQPKQASLTLAGGQDAQHLDLSSGSAARAATRYVPLYEAKMIHQFDHRWATFVGEDSRDLTAQEKENPKTESSPRYWVAETELDNRLKLKGWSQQWLLGWRDITNVTNERTAIFSFLPKSAVGHTMPLFFSPLKCANLAAIQANFCSLTYDFVTRQSVGGTHLTYGYLKQLPILPPNAYDEAALAFIVPRVLELTYTSHSMAPFARDLGHDGPPFAWDEDRRAKLRAELDAWYALAYGLNRDELRYILDPKDVMGEDYPSETFRVLQKNELARHGEYRTRRLVLAAYDELTAQGMRPRTEGYLR